LILRYRQIRGRGPAAAAAAGAAPPGPSSSSSSSSSTRDSDERGEEEKRARRARSGVGVGDGARQKRAPRSGALGVDEPSLPAPAVCSVKKEKALPRPQRGGGDAFGRGESAEE
jgi:hypothetical protein